LFRRLKSETRFGGYVKLLIAPSCAPSSSADAGAPQVSRIIIALFLFIMTSLVSAQAAKVSQDLSQRPIFVTTRVFQLSAKSGASRQLSDQVFKMRTSSLSEYDKWTNAFKKAYPGFEASLLKTETRRVFRTSKPSIITVARRPDGWSIEMMLNGAQSPGDGVTPGTTLVPEINLQFGSEFNSKPINYSMQQIEVETGATFFYAINGLRMNATDYVNFFRPNVPAEAFKDTDFFLLFAYSVDLDQTVEPVRYLDERQSLPLQEKATKTPQPEIPAGLRDAGIGGFVRVRVEISPAGQVTSANIQYSSFPEINKEALAAARQWEFPATLFADDKRPITGFIAFNYAAKSAAPATRKTAGANPSIK
jgi:TonB family protein